jgi:O-antigen/teichoic acid export membrane protein
MEVSAAIDVAVRLLAVGASIPLLIAGFGVTGVLAASLAAAVVGVLAYHFVLRHWSIPLRPGWTPTAWRADLSEAYPFALTSVSAMVYARADLLLLGFWRGEIAAGVYSAAYKLWEAVGLLPASLLDAMFPELSRLAASEGGRQRLRSVFGRVTLGLFAGGMLLAVVLALAASPIFRLVYGADGGLERAILPFRLLVGGIPAMFLYLFGGHILYALGRQRSVMVTMLAAGAVNVALNLIAIPRWSYLGAAAVALTSEWLLATALYAQGRRALFNARLEPAGSLPDPPPAGGHVTPPALQPDDDAG